MGIMAEQGQPQPPSIPAARYVPLKTARRQDIMHTTATITVAMTTTAVIAMVPADIALIALAVTAEPPQHRQALIMAEGMAVARH